MWRGHLRIAAVAAAALAAAVTGAGAQTCQNNPSAFPAWLDALRAEARAAGISPQAVALLNGVTFDQSIVNRDRAQGVFAQSFLEFSDRMVSSYRLETGARLLREHAALFARVEQDYGVPGPVIAAFWALETDFGANNGDFAIVPALATLAFDCRRPDEFRPQLLDALRLVDRGDLAPADLVGAWAGEMGQVQFRPTEYLATGVDYDGDGRVDLFRSVPDILASSANLLAHHGWRRGEPWLEEVTLTRALPWEEADAYTQHPRSDWAAWGVVRRDGSALPPDRVPTSLLLPMGRNGPAFLAYENFYRVYLEWNQSMVYTTTAAYLATRLAGAPRVSPGAGVTPLSIEAARELQTLLAGRGHDVGRIDGVIGAQTRAAVRAEQLRLGLPADGYPDQRLLSELRGSGGSSLTRDEIVELQTLLLRQGFEIGAADGVIGSRTRAAITEMQRRLGLPENGVATTEFLARLRAL